MTPTLILSGYDASDALPTLPALDYDAAIGPVPGWNILIDPDDIQGGQGVWNRVRSGSEALMPNISTVNNGIPLGSFSNGATAFAPSDAAFFSLGAGDRALNPDEWTVFAVARPTPRETSTHSLIGSKVAGGGSDVRPRVGFGITSLNARFAVYASGLNGEVTPRIGFSPSPTVPNRSSLYMATFSTRDGLRLFVDGEMVAENTDDKRPLNAGYAAGEWQLLPYTRGLFGLLGVLDVDLGWPENAGYRRRIEQAMKAKYAISTIV